MESLFTNDLDEKQRIVGAKGKRPFLKNLPLEHIRVFKEQVQLVSMIGEQNAARIAQTIVNHHAQGLPAFEGALTDVAVETVRAKEPSFTNQTRPVSSSSTLTAGLRSWW